MDRSKLFRTTSRPAVFTQKRRQFAPCPAFAPGVPQSSGPAALGLFLRGRGRVDDYPNRMCPVLLSEPEQLGNTSSHLFCLFASPQSNVELKYGNEIVVEREPAS